MTERDGFNETNKTKAGSDKPDLTGKEYYGVGKEPLAPNHAWDGREPYPQDVGGINHPGEEPMGLDPLTGDRGSAESEPEQPRLQLGDEVVEQPGGGTPAVEAQARPVSDLHHVEGGFEPSGVHTQYSGADRTFWDKAKDEVKSWTGDKGAEARRNEDQIRDEAQTTGGGDWQGHDDDTGWRDPVSPGKEAEVDKASPPTEAREHRPGQFRE